MAGSVNKVILIGNLGRDPEVKHFDNGGMIVNFPIATTETYRNRETGERITLPTDWHNIVIKRSGLAKVAESYLKKGKQVYIEGKLKTRTYEQNGETKYITEVVADELTMLGSARDGDSEQDRVVVAQPQPEQQPKPEPLTNADPEDDLPF
jgi:single-strand DNA-binding protein